MINVKRFIETGIQSDCKKYKNRCAGSKSEQNIQAHFADMLKAWSDSVAREDFTLHPYAFLGWIVLCALFELLSIAMLWNALLFGSVFYGASGLALAIISILMVWFEFFRYRKFVDRLFPKRTSHNVYAVRKSKNTPQKRIIFGGHADAAYEFRYIHLANGRYAMPFVFAAFAGTVVILFASLLALIFGIFKITCSVNPILFGIAAPFIPVFVAALFFTNWGRITDGANDNLSACYAAFSVMKYLEENNIRFDDTEVCCLITGSEESGLRGAEAFAKKHAADFKAVETIFIAMDTLREFDQLKVYTNGMYGVQQSSREVGALLQSAAAEIGIRLTESKPYPGAMDSDAFSREGIKACGLAAVDHKPQAYYHTRKDTSDNISPDCIEVCFRICLRAINLFSQKGLQFNQP